ncbi:unnamed protein product [Didymodactylos carnosus]|uniref:F-box domain-containing protein n=1 Tax=Didymodactylos carnosus TaxID=1234261 RepID=A0A813SVP0_9BILA|nr:unnamed protein product [Didymodactylos carnosus]CAF3585554.1 unnamed protein product [Didymodactylos carnosus]
MRTSVFKADSELSPGPLKRHYSTDEVDQINSKHDEKKISLHGCFQSDNLQLIQLHDHLVPNADLDQQTNTQIQKRNAQNSELFSHKLLKVSQWFLELTDDQRNILLRELSDLCNSSQWHLLSTMASSNWHRDCPDNCCDLLTNLPFTISLYILSFLDPVSLARSSCVSRLWYSLCSQSELWKKFCRLKKWHLSSTQFDQQQIEKYRLDSGCFEWKRIFIERYRLRSNWLKSRCSVQTFIGHVEGISCVQFDEKRIISGCTGGSIKVWDINTTTEIMTLVGHSKAVRCLFVDGLRLVSGSNDRSIKVRENFCVSGSHDNSIKIWDLKTGQCLKTLLHTGVVRCLQADTRIVLSGSDDKTIKVWNIETGERLCTLRNHGDGVTCLQFNDYMIVSGSYDRSVKLWNFRQC